MTLKEKIDWLLEKIRRRIEFLRDVEKDYQTIKFLKIFIDLGLLNETGIKTAKEIIITISKKYED